MILRVALFLASMALACAAAPAADTIATGLAAAEQVAAAEKWPEALKAGERLRALCVEQHGEEHPDTALADLFLGEVRAHLGDRTLAEAHIRRALSIQEKVLPKDSPELATTLTRLAASLKGARRFDEAAGLLQRALEVQVKAAGADSEATADATTNLARVVRLKGDAAAAAGLLERAVAIRRRLGGTDPATIEGLRELARLHEAAGNLPAADLATAERVVAVEARFGAQSPELAGALAESGRLAEAQGHFAEAEPRYRRALAVAEAAFGSDDPEVARAADALGWCLRMLERYDEARPLLERAVALQQRIAPDALGTVQSCRHLAWVLRLLREFGAARPLFERALAIRERALGTKDRLTLESLGELADLDWLRGACDEAAQAMELRRYRAEEAFGPASEETAAAWHGLAIVYESAKRWPQAMQAALRSLELSERRLGPADDVTLGEMLLLARICTAAGAFDPALAQFARLASWLRQHPEAGAAGRAGLLRQYAITMLRAGRRDEAGAIFLESRRAHESGLGANDPATLRSIADLWTYYDETRQPARALEVARELARRTGQAAGADAPATAEIFDRLGQLCLTLGDEAEAQRHFRSAIDARRRHFGEGSPEHLGALARVGAWFEQARDFKAATGWRTERLGAVRRKLGAESDDTAAACGDLALCYFRAGDLRSARGMFESQWELVIRTQAADSPAALGVIARLGDVAVAGRDWPVALRERERLAAGCARRFGPEHSEHARALLLLGEAQFGAGADAGTTLGDAYRILCAAEPAQPALAARAAVAQARVALRRGDREAAERWARDAVGRPFSNEEPLAEAFSNLGDDLDRAGDAALAERVFDAALGILAQVAGDHDEHTLALLRRLAILRLRLARPGAAALLERAVTAGALIDGAGSAEVADLLGWLAVARVRDRQFAAARTAAERMRNIHQNAAGGNAAAAGMAAMLVGWTTLLTTPPPDAGAPLVAGLAARWAWAEPLSGWAARALGAVAESR